MCADQQGKGHVALELGFARLIRVGRLGTVKASGLRNYVGVIAADIAATRATPIIVAHAVSGFVSDPVTLLRSRGIGVLVHPWQAETRDDRNGSRSVRLENRWRDGQYFVFGMSQTRRRERHGRGGRQDSYARRGGMIFPAAAAEAERGGSWLWFWGGEEGGRGAGASGGGKREAGGFAMGGSKKEERHAKNCRGSESRNTLRRAISR